MREHLRKQRRDERRNPNAKRKKRDPGIPNSWPFKQQLLAEQETRRAAEAEERAIERAARKAERAAQRAAEAAMQGEVKMLARERRAAARRLTAFAPLQNVLADADAVVIVVDARDVDACRSLELEQARAVPVCARARKIPCLRAE